MDNSREELNASLRKMFKSLNPLMLLNWRLGLGPILNAQPKWFGRYMVITHTGRKSGLRRQTPVNYAEVNGEIYCVAGFGQISDWYRNIRANPAVEVWLPDGWWQAVAEILPPSRENLQLVRAALIGSGPAAQVFEGVDPTSLSEAELADLTGWTEVLPGGAPSDPAQRPPYILMRIRRGAACTGPGGPGDLAWVWPLATLLLLPLACRGLFRRHR